MSHPKIPTNGSDMSAASAAPVQLPLVCVTNLRQFCCAAEHSSGNGWQSGRLMLCGIGNQGCVVSVLDEFRFGDVGRYHQPGLWWTGEKIPNENTYVGLSFRFWRIRGQTRPVSSPQPH